jgi:hypothetical protein
MRDIPLYVKETSCSIEATQEAALELDTELILDHFGNYLN